MLGDFLNNGREVLAQDGVFYIETGTPIVAMTFVQEYIQFGIFDGEENVICQIYHSESELFEVLKIPFRDNFFRQDCKLYEYVPQFEFDKNQALLNAKNCIGKHSDSLLSIPGDDFVFYCLTNRFINEFATELKFGLQYSTPYIIKEMLNAYHHCITIEGGYIIHFSRGGEDKLDPFIRLDSFNDFLDTSGKHDQIPYDKESDLTLTSCRNRAIYVLTGKLDFNKYKLFSNNCEHFALWCKTGIKKSRQLQEAAEELAMITLCIAARRPHPKLIKVVKKRINFPWSKRN